MLIPDNVGQLRAYLDTFDDETRVFVEGGTNEYDTEPYMFIVVQDGKDLVFKPIKFENGFPRAVYK